LVSKASKVGELEDALRQANILVSQVCSNNYRMMLNKTSDFLRQQDILKSKFELKLMEVEDQLSSETKKCEEVIKARIAPL